MYPFLLTSNRPSEIRGSRSWKTVTAHGATTQKTRSLKSISRYTFTACKECHAEYLSLTRLPLQNYDLLVSSYVIVMRLGHMKLVWPPCSRRASSRLSSWCGRSMFSDRTLSLHILWSSRTRIKITNTHHENGRTWEVPSCAGMMGEQKDTK
jgi:hypothetical protein